MDNEHLFIMLDECINYAKEVLTSSKKLESFAMVLEPNNDIRSIHSEQSDYELRYEELLERLREEAKADKVTAIALLSNVTIPESFSPAVSSGIRIHVEEKDFQADNKLSARLLYVPYQLYKTKGDDTVQIQLHDPIPVGLACEIFV
jgi:hypothetical protein